MTTVTVAELQARLDRARELIGAQAAKCRAEYEASDGFDRSFPHGAACGLEIALDILAWVLTPEQEWRPEV